MAVLSGGPSARVVFASSCGVVAGNRASVPAKVVRPLPQALLRGCSSHSRDAPSSSLQMPVLGSLCSRQVLCSALAGVAAGASLMQRRNMTATRAEEVGRERHAVTGLPPGPYPVGVTTLQMDDHSRTDPEGGARCLQTEIWYPAADEALDQQANLYSEFLSRGAVPDAIARAEDADAIGGYSKGLTIEALDHTWANLGRRDARVRVPQGTEQRWPVVIFSHGNGAFRASYVYFTEFLASHGFVVVACDHPGSCRYTLLNGKVVKGGGARAASAQEDRPKDVVFLLNMMDRLNMGADSRFAGRLDVSRAAVTGMSFGGWTSAKVVDMGDPRVKAAVLQCPSLARGDLHHEVETPMMIMLGGEDTVIGAEGKTLGRSYFRKARGPRYLLEIVRAGHVSFTSCEQYNKSYGNGIGPSRSLTVPDTTYEPLDMDEVHALVNAYTLAFLDAHLRGRSERLEFLEKNHFPGELVYDFKH